MRNSAVHQREFVRLQAIVRSRLLMNINGLTDYGLGRYCHSISIIRSGAINDSWILSTSRQDYDPICPSFAA